MTDTFTLPNPRKIDKREVSREDAEAIARLREAGYLERAGTARTATLVRHRESWDLFEQEILIYLMDGLKLADTDGGPLCYYGGHQVDACGGLDDVFLVVDAKHSENPGSANARSYVSDLARKMVAIRRDVLARFGTKYKAVCFAVFTNGEATNDEIEYGLQHGVFLADGRYYSEICRGLFAAIGPTSRYQLFRDFLRSLSEDEQPSRWKGGTSKKIKIPALRIEAADGSSLYQCFMKASDLLRLGYVARLEARSPGAYQRLLKREKLSGVRDFVRLGNTFKNNIVVGLAVRPTFRRARPGESRRVGVPEEGFVYIEDVPASVWIIDGQHRVYGYARVESAARDQHLPVMAMFSNENSQLEQALTFVEINKYQTPIKPDVLWALYSDVQPSTDEGIVSLAVRDLNSSGVFKDRIYVPDVSRRSRAKYRLFMNNACKGVVDRNFLKPSSPSSLIQARPRDANSLVDRALARTGLVSTLNDFFSLVKAQAGANSEWLDGFLFTNNGFNVFLRVLSELLLMRNGSYSRARATPVLAAPLKAFFEERAADVRELRGDASSEGGRADVAAVIIARINQHEPTFGHAFLRTRRTALTRSPESELLRAFEQLLRELIAEVCSSRDGAQWANSLPGDVKTRAAARQESNNALWPWAVDHEATLVDFLDFNDYAKVFRHKWTWFQPVFREPELVQGKLKELDPIRKQVMHSRTTLDTREYERLAMYLEDFRSLIGDWRGRSASG
ncbi:MAG TPA: DGQHR domain-containing protein [Thermoleophilia bacterium]|nr:DGQHR domain-containing protein [Thermoleophilia bacterium]